MFQNNWLGSGRPIVQPQLHRISNERRCGICRCHTHWWRILWHIRGWGIRFGRFLSEWRRSSAVWMFYMDHSIQFDSQRCALNSFYKTQSISLKLILGVDLCSHKRSVAYWSESVGNMNDTMAFYAKKRSSNDNNSTSNFDTDVVVMGIGCPATASGRYYLNTESYPPYALGMNGIDGIQWLPA